MSARSTLLLQAALAMRLLGRTAKDTKKVSVVPGTRKTLSTRAGNGARSSSVVPACTIPQYWKMYLVRHS
jgi:hypothetical protein